MSEAGSSVGEAPPIIPQWVANLQSQEWPGKNIVEGFPRDPPPYTTLRVRQFQREIQQLWEKVNSQADELEELTKERDTARAQAASDLAKNIELTEKLRLEEENTTILGAELRARVVVPVDAQVRAQEIQRDRKSVV